MNADQLKQHILMLRNQRAGIQVNLARAHVERHTVLTNIDKDIAAFNGLVLDLDVQIAEHMRDYTTKLREPDTSDKPRRPLGAVGTMIEVHPTMAHIYDAVTTAGVYTVPKALNEKNRAIVTKFCCDLVEFGVARWKDSMTLVPIKPVNPVGMPSPGRGGRP